MPSTPKNFDQDFYGEGYFERDAQAVGDSPEQIVKIIAEKFKPASVTDVGCGTGEYLRFFREKYGVKITGFDFSESAKNLSQVSDAIVIHDLTKSLDKKLVEKSELAMCVEVAEHLPPEAADVLVDTLCAQSDFIMFTAAQPGQCPVPDVVGHVNEKCPGYWHKKFAEKGYVLLGETDEVKKEMEAKGVAPWLPRNLMIFKNIQAASAQEIESINFRFRKQFENRYLPYLNE